MVKTIDILGFPHAYELSNSTDSDLVLVFVHGWLLSRTYWEPVIEQLAPHYQCLTYDLRGFGDSQSTTASNPATALDVAVQRQVESPNWVRERAVVGVGGSQDPVSASAEISANLNL